METKFTALIVLLVVVVTIIRATPINDGDAAVGLEKEQQVVDSAMLESRSNAGSSCSNDSQCSCRAGYRSSCSGGSCKCTFIK